MTTLPHRQTGCAAVDGAELFYESAGQGPAVVLLHAGIADSRMWDDQFAAFAARYRVVRYDLRGFGRSAMPQSAFSHRRDLAGLLDALGIERAALVGASFGGRVATEFALECPGRVAALLTVGAPVGGLAMSDALDAAEAEIEAAFMAGDFDRAAEVDLRAWVDGPTRRPADVEPAFRQRAFELARNVYAAEVDGGSSERLDPPAVARLATIAAPTLVVVGALDQPDILTAADLLAARIPGARQVVVPNAAHLPSMERPAAFNALALEFLSDTLP